LAWDKFLDEQSGQCNFVQFSYTLSPRGSYVLTQASYEETIEVLPDDFLLIMRSPTFSDCDIAYQSFITKSYYLIVGHLRFMDDQFPRWSDTPLDAKDHKLIKSLVMDDMKRIQRRMSSLTKYKLTVIETSPYTGKSLLELLEEDKHNTQE